MAAFQGGVPLRNLDFSLKAVGQSGRQLARGMSWAEQLFGKRTLAGSWSSRDKDRPDVEAGVTQQNKVRTGPWDSGKEGEGRERFQVRRVSLAGTRSSLCFWGSSYQVMKKKKKDFN